MRNILLATAAALLFSTAVQAARPPAQPSSALPGTIHIGPDPKTGKIKRLTARQAAPRTAGTKALEYDARRDGTGKR